MKYTGSCHCGRVKFEAEGEIASAMSCNCSMCQRKGALMWFVPRSAMRLLTPEADAATYLFNRHVIRHRFCATCGMHPYGEGTSPNGDAMAAINLRCVDGLDVDTLAIQKVDGASF